MQREAYGLQCACIPPNFGEICKVDAIVEERKYKLQ